MSLDARVGASLQSPPTAPTALPPAAPPPVLDGRYEVGRRIGGGGAATVYAARDLVLGRTVAVKVMRSDGEPDQAGRFDQEARLLAGLSHPGLVTVFDAGTAVDGRGDPQAYLVMEMVDGTTLARRLAGGPLSVEETAHIGGQLASALAYVHAQGIVHRDVKPANILMTPPTADGRTAAKLTDFGIARRLDSDRMTMQGFTVGTANYLSPEQATGDEVGPPADVYSLGLVLLECLTGAMAYPGHGVAAAAARLHRQPTVPSWLSPQWVELVIAMTQRDPAMRIDAAQAAAELSRLRATESTVEHTKVLPVLSLAAAGAGVATGAASGESVSRRHNRRRGWLAAGVAAAAIVIAALTSALAFGPVGPPSVGRPSQQVAPSTSSTPQPQAVTARSSTQPARTSTSPVKATPVKAVAPRPAPPAPRKHSKHGDH